MQVAVSQINAYKCVYQDEEKEDRGRRKIGQEIERGEGWDIRETEITSHNRDTQCSLTGPGLAPHPFCPCIE